MKSAYSRSSRFYSHALSRGRSHAGNLESIRRHGVLRDSRSCKGAVREQQVRYDLHTGVACWYDSHSQEAAMPDQPELRYRQLTYTLRDEYGHLGIADLRQIGEGMDAKVYRAHSAELGPVAIKMPHSRWMSSGNELMLDTRVILRKEFQLSRYLQARGLPG